jgi:hypothetical protein
MTKLTMDADYKWFGMQVKGSSTCEGNINEVILKGLSYYDASNDSKLQIIMETLGLSPEVKEALNKIKNK